MTSQEKCAIHFSTGSGTKPLKTIRDASNTRADEADQRNRFREIVSQVWDGGDGSVFIHGNQANFKTIVSWLHPGESISIDWFRNVIKENPAALLSQLSTTPTGRLISVDDDDAINAWLKLKGYGQSDANRALIKGACTGNSFYESQLEYAVDSGCLLLAKATEAEKNAIEAERAIEVEEKRQRQLLNATPQELKREIRDAAESRAVAARDSQDKQHLETLRARQDGQYPPLPAVWQGHQLTPEFIRTCDAKTQRILHRVYGNYQIDLRLRGLA